MFDQQGIKRAGLEEVLRQMPTAVMIVGVPSGEIILDNGQTQQMSERYLDQSELSGLGDLRNLHDSGVFELFHPDERPYEFEEWPVMRSIRCGEEVRDEEIVQRMADGTQLWLRCNSSPIYDEEGRIVAGVLVVHDVTERKRAEEALRESSRRNENILESITDEFNAFDREWRFTYLNEPALNSIRRAKGEELTREEVLGKNVWEMFPAHVGSVFYQKYHEAMREQKAVEFEARSPVTDRWIETHVSPSEEGLSVYYQDITERKRVEEQLAYHARLLENIHDAVTATDERFVVTAWNKGAEQMFGWTADEALGRKVYEVIPTDYSDEQLADTLRELSETGRRRSEGIRHRKDGTPVHAEALTIALRGEQGQITGYLGIHRDITERKRGEEELRKSEERFRATFEQAAVGMMHTAPDGKVLRVNRKLCDILGYAREELLQITVQQRTHPDDLDEDLEQARQLLAGEIETYSMEKRLFRKDDSIVWINLTVSLVQDPSGEPGYFIAVIEDITDRKRAEQGIETRTHQQAVVAELGLRALANNDLQSLMDEAVALVAQTLEVEYSKIMEPLPGGEEMLLRAGVGWEAGLVGSSTESTGLDSEVGYALHSEGSVIVEDVRTETRFEPSDLIREHGIVSSMTVVIHGREGRFGVLCAYAASRQAFSEDDATFLQAVANVLATAIERKEAEERLQEVREAERSRIARDLHDDALQDLTDALVEAQLAQSISKDPELTRRLGRLVAALDRMGPHLRGAVYDLGLGGEQDKSFSELLESLVELHRTMAPDCDIRLEIQDGVLEGPLGQPDREVLRILGEALTNARRHSVAWNVRVVVGAPEGKLRAEVEDDGQGFDLAQEPSAATGGMGIRGMQERARALGGELKIQSEPGKGTKVRFELALRKEPEEEPEEEVRVLLVEDHATVREALASALEREAGLEVVGQAGSLVEARRMLDRGADVAVVDLGLPDGYGADLIEELREANPRAQALVLSASLDRAQIARAVEAGAAGVLNKMTHLDEVVKAVRRLRVGQTLMPLEEVVQLLRFAGRTREEEHEARRVIEKLTPREKEVLEALAEGLDGQEIAERLSISLRTERNHMSSILAKLGVHSQLQALVFALRHGVAEIP